MTDENESRSARLARLKEEHNVARKKKPDDSGAGMEFVPTWTTIDPEDGPSYSEILEEICKQWQEDMANENKIRQELAEWSRRILEEQKRVWEEQYNLASPEEKARILREREERYQAWLRTPEGKKVTDFFEQLYEAVPRLKSYDSSTLTVSFDSSMPLSEVIQMLSRNEIRDRKLESWREMKNASRGLSHDRGMGD